MENQEITYPKRVRTTGWYDLYILDDGAYIATQGPYQSKLTKDQGDSLMKMSYLQFEDEISVCLQWVLQQQD